MVKYAEWVFIRAWVFSRMFMVNDLTSAVLFFSEGHLDEWRCSLCAGELSVLQVQEICKKTNDFSKDKCKNLFFVYTCNFKIYICSQSWLLIISELAQNTTICIIRHCHSVFYKFEKWIFLGSCDCEYCAVCLTSNISLPWFFSSSF